MKSAGALRRQGCAFGGDRIIRARDQHLDINPFLFKPCQELGDLARAPLSASGRHPNARLKTALDQRAAPIIKHGVHW